MPRLPKPTAHQGYFCTRAGSGSWVKLCPLEEGEDRAREALTEYLNGLRNQKVPVEKPITVAQVVVLFLTHSKANNRPETYKWYRKELKRLVLQFNGRVFAVKESRRDAPELLIGGERPVELRSLTLDHGNRYKLWLLQDLCLDTTTVNHHLRAAKTCLNWASKPSNLLIPFNPWKEVTQVPEEWRTRVVTDEEFQKLLAHATDGEIRDLMIVLRYTALRPQEVRVLAWDHVDLGNGLITVPAFLTKSFSTARNPSPRYSPILPEVRNVLEKRERSGVLIFPWKDGRTQKSDNLAKRFAWVRKKAGLDTPDKHGQKIVLYSLRHTRLTEASGEGLGFYQVKLLSGHHTSEMTKRYVHESPEGLIKSVLEKHSKAKD